MLRYLSILLFLCLPLSGCGNGDATRQNDFTPLTSIQVLSQNPHIANQTSNQFRAIGNFSGLFTRDITTQVTWTSSDPAVASVSNDAASPGLAKGVGVGTTTISATLNNLSGPFALEVINAGINSITLSPLTPDIPKGRTVQFQAIGTFVDALTAQSSTQDITLDASWGSSDTTKVTVSDLDGSKGLASAVDVGSATVSATFGVVTGETLMIVSPAQLTAIALSPATPSMLTLTDLQMRASGTYTDGNNLDITSQVTWSSSLPGRATISNAVGSEGRVSSLTEGSTTLSASLDSVTAATSLTVTGGNLTAITVTPANSTQLILDPALPVQMKAEGTFGSFTRDISDRVTWTSENTSGSGPLAAPIDAQGVVNPSSVGTARITAEWSGISGTTNLMTVNGVFNASSLVISPATTDNPVLTPGASLDFSAQGTFYDGSGNRTVDLTTAVTWTSSNETAAKISAQPGDIGRATGAAAGTTTISADFRGLGSDAAELTVNEPQLLGLNIDPPTGSLAVGETLQLQVTAQYDSTPVSVDVTKDATWTTSNPFVVDFSDPNNPGGKLVGVNSGSAVITATFGILSQTVTISVP